MNIIAICDKQTAIGLKLAGIKDVYILDPSDQDNIIKKWNRIEDETTALGLIIITEEIAEILGKQLEQYRLSHLLPIILEIPNKYGRKKDHVDYVTQLIKRAVGMELKR